MNILIQKLKGQTLRQGWTQRPQESEDEILTSLASIVEQLRNIPIPSNSSVSNVVGRPIHDRRLPDGPFFGPFDSVHEFHAKISAGLVNSAKPEALLTDPSRLCKFYAGQCPPLCSLTAI